VRYQTIDSHLPRTLRCQALEAETLFSDRVSPDHVERSLTSSRMQKYADPETRRFIACSIVATILLTLVPGVSHSEVAPHARMQRASETPPGDGVFATPPAIPLQPTIRDIRSWGDTVAVITDTWVPSRQRFVYRLATVDRNSRRLDPFTAIRCDSYDDVAYSSELGKLLLCRARGTTQLYRFNGRRWIPMAGPVRGIDFRCAVDRDRVALISSDTIYLLSVGARAPAALRIGVEEFREAPAAALLNGDSLFLGYDRGEFGGALYHVDLGRPIPAASRLLTDSIRFIARSPSGSIWAASGLAHLVMAHAALYRLEPTRTELIASISGVTSQTDPGRVEASGVPFPAVTSVEGLAFTDDGRPIVVFPDLGVFTLTDGSFQPLYRGSLVSVYEASFNGIPARVSSSPVAVMRAPSGELYVATRSLGVLVIDGARVATQLTFDRRWRAYRLR
jgi:hypothetical protein